MALLFHPPGVSGVMGAVVVAAHHHNDYP